MRQQTWQWTLCLICLTVAASCWSTSAGAADIVVKALLKDMAVVEIDGQRESLRAGESFAGVTLISADSKAGIFDVNGERRTLKVGRHMGANYTAPERTAVRIASNHGGHFVTPGRINKRPVTFMVDTGATTIAMNSQVARQLGIDYLAGQVHSAQTASGVVSAYRVMLDNVAIGSLILHNVEASVLEGAFPAQILLGNSYLSRVDMKVNNGVLVLQAKF